MDTATLVANLRATQAARQRPQQEVTSGGGASSLGEIASRVGGFGVGVVSAVGNALDLPGSTIRDLLAGKGVIQSIDQWASPFTSENRTTGRQLLEQYGIARKNRETGVFGWTDPEEAVMDIGGFLLEVVADPLGPIGKAVGLTKLVNSGFRQAARGGASLTRRLPGGRQLLRGGELANAKIKELFDHRVFGTATPERQAAVTEAAPLLRKEEDLVRGHMVDTLTQLNEAGWDHADEQQVYGLLRHLNGTEDWREATTLVDDTVDIVNPADGITRRGRVAGIDTSTDGRITNYSVETPEGIFQSAQRKLDDGTVEMSSPMTKVATDPNVRTLPEPMRKVLSRWRPGGDVYEMVRSASRAAGQRTPELVDQTGLEYFARQMTDQFKKVLLDENGKIRGLGANGWNAEPELYRNFLFKDFYGGDETVNNVLKDSDWNDIVDRIKEDNPLPLDASGKAMFGSDKVAWSQLSKFADKVGMTTDDLWEEIGFDLTKPYAPLNEVTTALSNYRQKLAGQVAQGKGTLRTRRGGAGRDVFESLHDSTKSRAVMVSDKGDFGLPKWATPQEHNLQDPAQFDEIGRALGGSPEVLGRLNAMRAANQKVFSWLEDQTKAADGWEPLRKYYTPQLESTFEAGFKRNLSSLAADIEKAPVAESDVIAKALSASLRKKYGHVVMRDMPHVNANGKFEFIDSASGYKLETPIGDLQKAKSEFDAAQALGLEVDPNKNLYAKVQAGKLQQVMDDRYDHLGAVLERRPNLRDYKLFGNNPIIVAADMSIARLRGAFVDKQMRQLVRDTVIGNAREDAVTGGLQLNLQRTESGIRSDLFPPTGQQFGSTLSDMLQARQKTLDPKLFLRHLKDDIAAAGIDITKHSDEALNAHLLSTTIDPRQFRDIQNLFKYFEAAPDINSILKAWDSAGTIMKGNLLATPATVFRNIMSGSAQSVIMGDTSATGKGMQSFMDGFRLASGKVVDVPLTPDMEQFMKVAGRDPNNIADRSAAFVARMVGSLNKLHLHSQMDSADVADVLTSGSAARVLDQVPGKISLKGMADGLATFWKSQPIYQHFNPVNVPGVMKLENSEIVTRSSQHIGSFITGHMQSFGDNAVRMAGVLSNMRKGMSFDEAFAKVQWNQVSYDPRNYTRFEKQVMKRLFPFYSFMSRSLPMVAMELATNPGGGLGRTIRAQRLGVEGEDQYVPSEVQDTSAIPLAPGNEGQLRYLTSLGLMHEDALQYIAPTQGVRGLLQKVIGSSNPIMKTAVEYGTNTSTFFEGPMGGRRLDDLDPKLGRILFNIRTKAASMGLGTAPQLAPSGRPDPVGGSLIEAMAANSPLASYLRYVHVATDPRRSTGDKVLNLATGLRTKEFSDEALVREIRDRLNALQVQYGARPLTMVTGTKGLEEDLRERGMETEANRIAEVGTILEELRKRAKKGGLASGRPSP